MLLATCCELLRPKCKRSPTFRVWFRRIFLRAGARLCILARRTRQKAIRGFPGFFWQNDIRAYAGTQAF
jgi:hypothetical protein